MLLMFPSACFHGARASNQQNALREIEALGGTVTIMRDNGKEIIAINLTGCKQFDNSKIRLLTQIDSLTALDLSRIPIGDEGLKLLSKINSLESLNLCLTRISDAGVKELRELINLQHLELVGAQITDAGVQDLRNLTQLRYLDLSGTLITNECIPSLVMLKNLKELWLLETKITDAGLERIRQTFPDIKLKHAGRRFKPK